MNTVFLNGQFVPYEEACISPEDRGFLFADGIYEVMRVYNGSLFRFEDHMARLRFGGTTLDLRIPYTDEAFRDFIHQLLAHHDLCEASVYLQVTRGASPRRHPFPEEYDPTVFMMVRSVSAPEQAIIEQGVDVITHPDNRGGLCYIKTLNLLANCIAMTKAEAQGAYEALLVRNGFVTEATARSAFCVIDNRIYTYPLANILPSITRKQVLAIARDAGSPVVEQALPVDTYINADEIFLGGTLCELVPVVRVDKKPVGSGVPGPVFQKVHSAFMQLIAEECGT